MGELLVPMALLHHIVAYTSRIERDNNCPFNSISFTNHDEKGNPRYGLLVAPSEERILQNLDKSEVVAREYSPNPFGSTTNVSLRSWQRKHPWSKSLLATPSAHALQ